MSLFRNSCLGRRHFTLAGWRTEGAGTAGRSPARDRGEPGDGRGAYVSHDGDVAVWARQVSKGGKTLALRDENGAPRWTQATAEDPDGCGVSHAPVRY